MRYDERSLHSVTFGLFDPFEKDGEKLIATTVNVRLSSQDGAGSGPGLQIQLAFEADENTTFTTAKSDAIKFAYEMIQRIAKETPETFSALAQKEPLFQVAEN